MARKAIKAIKATKATKASKAHKAPVSRIEDPARKLWLAGIGAISRTRERGEVAIENLIEQTRELQSRAMAARQQVRKAVRQRVSRVTQPIAAAVAARAEAATNTLEHGVGVVLSRLGVPSKADVAELSQRVSALSRQLRAAKR